MTRPTTTRRPAARGSSAPCPYMDATRDLPGMIKLVERTPAQEDVYAAIHRASVGWDGSDPMRRTDG